MAIDEKPKEHELANYIAQLEANLARQPAPETLQASSPPFRAW